MSDQTLLYWGIVVMLFLFFSFVLTARQLFENYMERRRRD